MRRNGAHSVSDCVEKAWRPPSKDTDVRRYACPVCGGRENENNCMMSRRAEPERHDAASRYVAGSQSYSPGRRRESLMIYLPDVTITGEKNGAVD